MWCKIEDIPLILNSLTCFFAFVVFGALAASLGSAIPLIAVDLQSTSSSLGAAFTTRGIGFAMGALLAAYLINLQAVSNELLVCLSLLIAGVMEFLVPLMDSLVLVLVTYGVQGIAYGVMNTVANYLLPELWGRRVQPWMQALHSCFGIGAMIGPAMVGALGYDVAFRLIGFAAVVPLIFHFSTICYTATSPTKAISNHNQKSTTEANYSKVSTLEYDDDLEDFDTPKNTENVSNNPTIDPPLYLKLILSCFFLIYIGAEASFGGWVSDYALEVHITDSASDAAYLSAIFWGSLTAGRVFSIVTAIFLSATTMIRLQLSLGVISTFLSITIMNNSYALAAFVSGCVGFALSAMYPVMITIVGDYGFKMDANTTTIIMLGTTIGEAIIPIAIGECMQMFSPSTMPWVIFICTVFLCVIYCIVHVISLRYVEQFNKSSTNRSVEVEMM